MKKRLTFLMEWLRPAGIVFAFFLSESIGTDAASKLHILGPLITIIMCGTVGLEALFLGKEAAEKIGYAPNRAYQVQSGLANLAIAVTAIFVYFFSWGVFADATITTVMLTFFTFSAANHTATIIRDKNTKTTNLMRPIMTIILLIFILPHLIRAVAKN